MARPALFALASVNKASQPEGRRGTCRPCPWRRKRGWSGCVRGGPGGLGSMRNAAVPWLLALQRMPRSSRRIYCVGDHRTLGRSRGGETAPHAASKNHGRTRRGQLGGTELPMGALLATEKCCAEPPSLLERKEAVTRNHFLSNLSKTTGILGETYLQKCCSLGPSSQKCWDV